MATRDGRRSDESNDYIDPRRLKRILPGLNALLLESVRMRHSASDSETPGLSVSQLARLGIDRSECQNLLAKGVLAVSGPLKASSRISLTQRGKALMQKAIPEGAVRPHYEIASRELRVGGQRILDLHTQARNLAAFLKSVEDARWASRVTGALSETRGGNDRHHLANAASDLNTMQQVILFRTDDGAVCWKWR